MIVTFLTLLTAIATTAESESDLLKDFIEVGDNSHRFSLQAPRLEEKLTDNERILKPSAFKHSKGKDKRPTDQKKPLPIVPLEKLEKDFRAAPGMSVAIAELEESLGMAEQKKARNGLKVFGGAGLGAYREPVTDTVVRDFQRANVKLGVRYPLLGSLKQERLDIFKAETEIWEKEHEIQLILQNGLGALRTFYINYWGNRKKIDISRVFLENEQEVEKILQHRTNAGYLLDSDRQEFMSAFALVRRNIADFKSSRNRALNVLRVLTDAGLKDFSPVAPELPMPCLDVEKITAAVIDTSLELTFLREQLKKQQILESTLRHTDVKGAVSLAGTTSTDFPENQPGYGVTFNVNIEFPVHINKAEAARKKVYRATLKKIKHQLVQKKNTLMHAAEESLERYLAALENVRFATRRLNAGRESVRESLLRSAFLEGDTIEKLQQSRYRYYQSAIAYIDAETNKMLTQVKVLEFSSGDCLPNETDPGNHN